MADSSPFTVMTNFANSVETFRENSNSPIKDLQ